MDIPHKYHEFIERVEYLQYAGPKFDHLRGHVVDIDLPQQLVYIDYLRHHLQVEFQDGLVLLLVEVLGEEGLGAIDTGFDEVALHEGVGEGEDGIVDVFLNIVGNVL